MMKQYWQRLETKIDRLSLRERVIIFAAVALGLVSLINGLMIDPQFATQKKLATSIKQDQDAIAKLQIEIQQKIKGSSNDADAPAKARLKQLTEQIVALQASMRDMQKGLVSPDRMPSLLEGILNQNGKLKLVSLKTLPVSDLNEPVADKPAPASAVVSPATSGSALPKPEAKLVIGAVYKHGVEITVRGKYLDMLDYLAKLESMPWQLFWGKAQFSADEYPENTLTLTLYTLSLDKAWLNL